MIKHSTAYREVSGSIPGIPSKELLNLIVLKKRELDLIGEATFNFCLRIVNGFCCMVNSSYPVVCLLHFSS